jgi:hypothetical protein
MDSVMNADYISLVIVGRSEDHKAWHWTTWSKITAWLNPIVAEVYGKAGVRSVQGIRESHRQVRFGRLGWNENSHQKWTHGSELSVSESSNWKFAVTEVWIPSWTECVRKHTDPQLFIQIEDPFLALRARRGQFNQFFHLAVTRDFYLKHRGIVDEAMDHVSALLDGVLVLARFAPWNINFDCVQDALNNHLHYIGMHEDDIPNISKTTGKWLRYGQ